MHPWAVQVLSAMRCILKESYAKFIMFCSNLYDCRDHFCNFTDNFCVLLIHVSQYIACLRQRGEGAVAASILCLVVVIMNGFPEHCIQSTELFTLAACGLRFRFPPGGNGRSGRSGLVCIRATVALAAFNLNDRVLGRNSHVFKDDRVNIRIQQVMTHVSKLAIMIGVLEPFRVATVAVVFTRRSLLRKAGFVLEVLLVGNVEKVMHLDCRDLVWRLAWSGIMDWGRAPSNPRNVGGGCLANVRLICELWAGVEKKTNQKSC